MNNKSKTALVLSGGGARSFCQIGVLKVLEKEKIPINLIVGCSMGSAIGALFATGVPAKKIEELIFDFCQQKRVRDLEKQFTLEPQGIKKIGEFIRDIAFYIIDIFREGVWEEENLMESLSRLIPSNLTFADAKIPFACVATDVKEGKRILIQEGNLLRFVAASSSVPGLFSPIKDKGRILVDGGVLSRMPVTAAEKMGADFVIAMSSGKLDNKKPSKALEVLMRATEIRELEFARIESSLADFLFSPPMEKWDWFSFSKAKEIIDKGEEEAKIQVSLLKEALNKENTEKKNLRRVLLPLFY